VCIRASRLIIIGRIYSFKISGIEKGQTIGTPSAYTLVSIATYNIGTHTVHEVHSEHAACFLQYIWGVGK